MPETNRTRVSTSLRGVLVSTVASLRTEIDRCLCTRQPWAILADSAGSDGRAGSWLNREDPGLAQCPSLRLGIWSTLPLICCSFLLPGVSCSMLSLAVPGFLSVPGLSFPNVSNPKEA